MRDSRVKRNKNLADVLTEAKNYMDKKTEEKIEFWSSKGKPVRWPKIFVVLRMYWKVRTFSCTHNPVSLAIYRMPIILTKIRLSSSINYFVGLTK